MIMKISVCLCIRNGEKYLEYINELFNKIELSNSFEFDYYIYENNSTDETKKLFLNSSLFSTTFSLCEKRSFDNS